MFEIKETAGEQLLTGTFVDVVEFGKRYSRLHDDQKRMLAMGCFCGNIDDYALFLDYPAPASSQFRQSLREMENLDFISVEPYTPEFYNSYKHLFADCAPFKKEKHKERARKCFMVLPPAGWINHLLEVNANKLPKGKQNNHKCTDDREKANSRRHENHIKSKGASK